MKMSGGEPHEASASNIINAKYEELQKARLMKMDLEKKMSISVPLPEAKAIEEEYRKLGLVIPQLEKEFEDLKSHRAENLEKRFGQTSANEESPETIMQGSEDERKAA